MTVVRTRVRIASDGTLTGRASGLPPGEHEAEIVLFDSPKPTDRPDADALLARVRAIQEEVARTPSTRRPKP